MHNNAECSKTEQFILFINISKQVRPGVRTRLQGATYSPVSSEVRWNSKAIAQQAIKKPASLSLSANM